MDEDFTEIIWLLGLVTILVTTMILTGCSGSRTVNIPVKCEAELPKYTCKVDIDGVDECAIQLQQYTLALEVYKKKCGGK